jgi:hypothetical protein
MLLLILHTTDIPHVPQNVCPIKYLRGGGGKRAGLPGTFDLRQDPKFFRIGIHFYEARLDHGQDPQ